MNLLAALGAIVSLGTASWRTAQGQPPAPARRVVVARINGDAVFHDEVDFELAITLASYQARIDPAWLPSLRGWALDRVINRRLIHAHWARESFPVPPPQLDAQWHEHLRELERRQTTLEKELRRSGVGIDVYRGRFDWNAHWRRFLESSLEGSAPESGREALEAVEGESLVRVRHILLRTAHGDGGFGEMDAITFANELRRRILGKEMSFEEAARRYSVAPSREDGGDLGFITRHGEMAEALAEAAFGLRPGEISPPVASPFGIHLILCTQIMPADPRPASGADHSGDAAVGNRVFRRLAARLRASASIEFTGSSEYFDPGSGKLIMGPASADPAESP